MRNIAVYILLVFSAVEVLPASAGALEPYKYVLALQRLQDQVVYGDPHAHEAQREMLGLMATDFANAKVTDWQKKKNAEALLVYLLSGGNPEFAEKLLEIKNQPKLPKGAFDGALAYVFGHYGKARRSLEDVNLKELSLGARSQLAIVQATLYANSDYKKALAFLSDVRLWKPGTLLEEAALRRSISLAGDHKNIDSFLLWSSQYARRFPHSFYMPEFLTKFSYYLTKHNLADNPDRAQSIVKIIGHLKKNQQASIYLTIARAAILDGKNKPANLMATKAMNLLKDSTNYSAQAKLFVAASQIASQPPEKLASLLVKVDRKLLNVGDKKIFDTVALMIAEVRKSPQTIESSLDDTEKVTPGGKPGERQIGQTSRVVSKAKKLIDQATKLLEANR